MSTLWSAGRSTAGCRAEAGAAGAHPHGSVGLDKLRPVTDPQSLDSTTRKREQQNQPPLQSCSGD